jgi:hypothetical protein
MPSPLFARKQKLFMFYAAQHRRWLKSHNEIKNKNKNTEEECESEREKKVYIKLPVRCEEHKEANE